MSGWRKVAEFLALRRNPSLLLGAVVLALTAERLWLNFAPKYLESLGATLFAIGVFDGLLTVLGAVYAYPGGWLTDRMGQRRSLLLFNGLSLAGYTVVLVWPHWLALLLGSFLFIAWSALSLPATFSVVATAIAADKHTMGIGLQSLVRRVPMMLGPLAGGWLITHHGWAKGVQLALLGCILLSLATAVFQWFMVEPEGEAEEERKTHSSATLFDVLRSFSPTLRELLVSDILIRFCERIPFAFAIFWVMDHAGQTAQDFSYLVAIEMTTAMLCYIPVAHLADKHGRRPFVLATFVFFTLYPLTMLWGTSFWTLAAAFAVRGMKEFGEPARKALILGEATAALRARTYGAYYLVRDCVVTLGSLLGAWLWSLSPQANFLGAAAFGAAGTLWFWWFVHRRPAAGEARAPKEGPKEG